MVLVGKGALLNLFCNKDTYEKGRCDTTIKDFVHINFSLHSVWLLFKSLLYLTFQRLRRFVVVVMAKRRKWRKEI